jgi:hypothetical protein
LEKDLDSSGVKIVLKNAVRKEYDGIWEERWRNYALDSGVKFNMLVKYGKEKENSFMFKTYERVQEWESKEKVQLKVKDKDYFNCGRKGHWKADYWASSGGSEGKGPQQKKNEPKKEEIKWNEKEKAKEKESTQSQGNGKHNV